MAYKKPKARSPGRTARGGAAAREALAPTHFRGADAFRKWPTGTYAIWYPAKNRRQTDALAQHVAAAARTAKPPGKCLRVEFSISPQTAGAPLASTGLLIVNPPFPLHGELKTILPELEKPLGQGGAARFRLEVPKL